MTERLETRLEALGMVAFYARALITDTTMADRRASRKALAAALADLAALAEIPVPEGDQAPAAFPHIRDEAFEVGLPAEYTGTPERAEVVGMLLDELAGEPLPSWFGEELDYQAGEAAAPVDRLPDGLASGQVPDAGKGEGP